MTSLILSLLLVHFDEDILAIVFNSDRCIAVFIGSERDCHGTLRAPRNFSNQGSLENRNQSVTYFLKKSRSGWNPAGRTLSGLYSCWNQLIKHKTTILLQLTPLSMRRVVMCGWWMKKCWEQCWLSSYLTYILILSVTGQNDCVCNINKEHTHHFCFLFPKFQPLSFWTLFSKPSLVAVLSIQLSEPKQWSPDPTSLSTHTHPQREGGKGERETEREKESEREYLVWAEVVPEICGFVVLHVAQMMVRVVHDEEIRHDRHDLCQLQFWQLNL